jgi:hypothetical protein
LYKFRRNLSRTVVKQLHCFVKGKTMIFRKLHQHRKHLHMRKLPSLNPQDDNNSGVSILHHSVHIHDSNTTNSHSPQKKTYSLQVQRKKGFAGEIAIRSFSGCKRVNSPHSLFFLAFSYKCQFFRALRLLQLLHVPRSLPCIVNA